jgi:hypothetical protein
MRVFLFGIKRERPRLARMNVASWEKANNARRDQSFLADVLIRLGECHKLQKPVTARGVNRSMLGRGIEDEARHEAPSI